MAAITYTDGVERDISTQECTMKVWLSPSTADSADTVIVPTITGSTLRVLECFDCTTGDSVTATVSTFTVTLDAGGADTDAVYALTYMYEQA